MGPGGGAVDDLLRYVAAGRWFLTLSQRTRQLQEGYTPWTTWMGPGSRTAEDPPDSNGNPRPLSAADGTPTAGPRAFANFLPKHKLVGSGWRFAPSNLAERRG